MEAGKERLTRDSVRDATQQEVQALRRENLELKQLVADLSLEVHRLKKTSIPMPQGAGGFRLLLGFGVPMATWAIPPKQTEPGRRWPQP